LQITKLSRTKNGLRVNIEVDKNFRLAVEDNTLIKNNLYVGKEISEEEIGLLQRQDIQEFGYRIALRYLEKRMRSQKEIVDYLLKKVDGIEDIGNKQEILDIITTKLKTQGYINDLEFGKFLLRSKLSKRNKSTRELEQFFIKYGVSKDIYSQLLEQEFNKGSELEVIENLISKKIRTSKFISMSKKDQKNKLYEFLARKGFNSNSIKTALESI
jgi:regulatory protein